MSDLTTSFTWDRIAVCFPEWATDLKTGKKEMIPWKGFPQNPKFNNGTIDFLYKNDYGIQIFLGQSIPGWIPEEKTRVNGKPIKQYYEGLSRQVYREVVSQLDLSFDILESWRHYVKKYDGREWRGHLQDHIDFEKSHDGVVLWDYFNLDDFERSTGHSESPTDRIVKILKLPRNALNEKWLKYAELSVFVEENPGESTTNKIVGSSIYECVKRADEIYKMVEELKS